MYLFVFQLHDAISLACEGPDPYKYCRVTHQFHLEDELQISLPLFLSLHFSAPHFFLKSALISFFLYTYQSFIVSDPRSF